MLVKKLSKVVELFIFFSPAVNGSAIGSSSVVSSDDLLRYCVYVPEYLSRITENMFIHEITYSQFYEIDVTKKLFYSIVIVN